MEELNKQKRKQKLEQHLEKQKEFYLERQDKVDQARHMAGEAGKVAAEVKCSKPAIKGLNILKKFKTDLYFLLKGVKRKHSTLPSNFSPTGRQNRTLWMGEK